MPKSGFHALPGNPMKFRLCLLNRFFEFSKSARQSLKVIASLRSKAGAGGSLGTKASTQLLK